ncbi:MAG: DNA polymerase/3'-5' exonuclease PolX [Clostridia bacterium]|nr:DNA polymerase/3'-5' exonuclease PolX [Clostridia bacterium]
MISNRAIAAYFEQIADLLELLGENQFKVRAYTRAAEALTALAEPAIEVLEQDPKSIPGVGEALLSKIREISTTGRLEYLEKLRSQVPAAILALTAAPGIGPKAAWKLHEALGIQDVAELAEAARAHRIRAVPGFGAKTEANIIRAIRAMQSTGGRHPLYSVIPLAERIVADLAAAAGVERVSIAGSLRRRRDTVGDIDVVAAGSDGGSAMKAFASIDVFREITAMGETKATGVTEKGISCDLRVVSLEEYASALHHLTGSKEHNVRLRGVAGRRGLKINEYGVFRDGVAERLPVESEEELYALLEMDYIPPELREDRGEIEAAASHALPHLIERSSIRGDLHAHTSWSDGVASISEMAEAARSMGHEYLAITDHSHSLGVAHGLAGERLLEQLDEVRRMDRRAGDRAGQQGSGGIRVLAGTEVDILKDGGLDFSDEILSQLDVVIASIHSGFQQDRDTITRRIIRAMNNPNVDIIAHPTGRLLGKRPGYDVDMDAIIREAAATGAALEINSYPDRLDLSDEHAKAARDAGVMISIDTDSHSPDELRNIEYGVWVGRRAWLEPRNVLNTLSCPDLLAWLSSHRSTSGQ